VSVYPYGRFQFCWYGWRGPWLRCFFERGGTAMFTLVFRWRIAIGPLDIRRWVPAPRPPRES
jgi:hypothetical protein